MDLFEYQAMELFAAHSVPVTAAGVATTPAEARAWAEKVAGPVVIKGHRVHRVLVTAASDIAEESGSEPLEDRARAKGLNYVKLDGQVGIVGNSAGLVMSTLDVVAYAGEKHGGCRPANFLEGGGGASAQIMADGLDIIVGDPSVRSVFVNVFGGITSCHAVANGIVQAFGLLAERGESVNKPLVVRLDGNNAELGGPILADAALPGVEPVDNMDDAADRAAELTSQGV